MEFKEQKVFEGYIVSAELLCERFCTKAARVERKWTRLEFAVASADKALVVMGEAVANRSLRILRESEVRNFQVKMRAADAIRKESGDLFRHQKVRTTLRGFLEEARIVASYGSLVAFRAEHDGMILIGDHGDIAHDCGRLQPGDKVYFRERGAA